MKPWTNPGRMGAGFALAAFFECLLVFSLWVRLPALAGASGVLGLLAAGFALNTSHHPAPGDVRKFGFAAVVFFGVFFALVLWRGRPTMAGVFGCLFVLGMACAVFPDRLRAVQGAWAAMGLGFAHAVNAAFLVIAWFFVITPFALALRVLGKRPIPLLPDPEAPTYWVSRKEQAQPRSRYGKRY